MFEILEKIGKKRLGKITTLHGPIFTPAFGPDATRGLVKSISPHEILSLTNKPLTLNNQERRNLGETQFILTNTYHMRIYPGDEFIKKMGGIHSFMQWPLPILTDSGGFQVFSLINAKPELKGRITEDGAIFKNPLNGDTLNLTPEIAMDIQFNLGSDIMVVLDDPKHPTNHAEMEASVERTIAWAKRCKKRYEENLEKYNYSYDLKDNKVNRPLLIGVIQGGNDLNLRKYCLDELEKIGFDGYGYGGYPADDEGNFPYKTLEYLTDIIPEDKIRYAMGIGTPENIKRCIEMGYDLFDCVIPSRNARHGFCYTTEGNLNILNKKYKDDLSSLDPNLDSFASQYSKYYLHHLFKIKDPLGGELLTIQNLRFFNEVCGG